MVLTTESSRDVPVSGQNGAKAPAVYQGFDGQYIDGSWRPGKLGGVRVDTDPYSGATLAETVMANQDDLDEAYHAAAAAQVSWAARLPAERAAVMLRSASIMETRHGEIVDWLIRESGSTRIKAELEWQFVHTVTLEAASFPHRMEGRILPLDEAGKESRAYRQPLGVIGVISPWNFPMYLSHRSIGPALALGNAVVVKPAQDTPVTGGLLIAKIYEEAGLPAGLLNVVIGPHAEIGDQFTTHPIPRLISFTGSTPVGRHIAALAMQAPQLKRVALELGGNAPLVVLDDADLEHSVRSAVVGRFLHQGQICMSANRIIVDAKVHDEFVERFIAHVKTLKYGDPTDPSVSIGPVINEKQLRGHLARIEGARKEGARELLGGLPDRQVLPPHIFAGVTNDMPIAQDEIFGPIAPIIKVKDEEEALHVEAGMTHVNDHSVDDTPTGPFGGEKNSGLGRFGGEWILREFTRDHWLTVRQSKSPYPF